MSVVESLKDYFQREKIEPCELTDLWAALATGEAQLIVNEISREVLCNRLNIRVRMVNGKEYEIDITPARKWV